MMSIKTYSELMTFLSYKERFEYLRLNGAVGRISFGHARYLNQMFYRSREWKEFRRKIIIRDNGCDLGCEGRKIFGRAIIHHINPITKEDILNHSSALLDPENVITTIDITHKAIHYGDEALLILEPIERKSGDTCLWHRIGG